MTDLPFVGAERLLAALSMSEAIDALERAFGEAPLVTPQRSHLDVGTGDLLLMPAWGDESLGVKLVTVAPGNAALGLPSIQGTYVLFDKQTLSPVMSFDAAALTALRTAAVSGVATRYLAREDAKRLVIFGAGVQAHAHLTAMATVRDVESVRIVSPARASQLVQVAKDLGLDADVGAPADASEADIICTCTTSSEPVLEAKHLQPGTHVNAIGSYKHAARELASAVLEGARVVIDTETALTESGDLLTPLDEGIISASEIETLAEVVTGDLRRAGNSETTVFKSVGAAPQDLVIAQAAATALG